MKNSHHRFGILSLPEKDSEGHPYVGADSSSLKLILAGLSHVMPARLTAQAGRPLACFVGGLFFAIACSHCLGATLYSILLAAGATGSPSSGMLVMFLFSLGLAVSYQLGGKNTTLLLVPGNVICTLRPLSCPRAKQGPLILRTEYYMLFFSSSATLLRLTPSGSGEWL